VLALATCSALSSIATSQRTHRGDHRFDALEVCFRKVISVHCQPRGH
jgi:hypothetical protein